MKLSTSQEAVSCAATQELPGILWNQKVLYYVHKRAGILHFLNVIL
jgi:hypothetical protein